MWELALYTLFSLSLAAAALLAGFVLALAYGRWYWDGSELTGDRRSEWFRSWRVWRWLLRYFNVRVKLADGFKLPGNARVLFVQYPHGFSPLPLVALTQAHEGSVLEPWFRDVFFAGASAIAWVPGLRDFCLAGGYVDVGRESIRTFCHHRPKANLMIAPGGIREMVRARYGKDDLYLGHTGFLDAAKEEGFDYVVPIFVEKQTDAFFCGRWVMPLRDWALTHLGIPFPSFVVPFPLPTNATVHVGHPTAVDGDTGWKFPPTLVECISQTSTPERVRIWLSHTESFTLEDKDIYGRVSRAFKREPPRGLDTDRNNPFIRRVNRGRSPYHKPPDGR